MSWIFSVKLRIVIFAGSFLRHSCEVNIFLCVFFDIFLPVNNIRADNAALLHHFVNLPHSPLTLCALVLTTNPLWSNVCQRLSRGQHPGDSSTHLIDLTATLCLKSKNPSPTRPWPQELCGGSSHYKRRRIHLLWVQLSWTGQFSTVQFMDFWSVSLTTWKQALHLLSLDGVDYKLDMNDL